ncbi:MAG: hypothetical protein F4Z81_04950 [Gemmatimonadetes bacterium]|nr:hypothetical protein [Gemmatimonadota bacterium]MYB60393.1 hypothetical protein [Gemmatimonadota bacterium]
MDLNNREFAAVIWTLFVIGLAMLHKDLRKCLWNILKIPFQNPVLFKFVAILLGYVSVILVLLYVSGIWTIDLQKETVMWFFFAGIVQTFKIAKDSNTITSPARTLVTDSVKAIVILEYLVSTYTFSVFIELLLQFFLITIGLANAVAKTNEEYKSAETVTGWMLASMGFVIAGSAIYSAFYDFKTLASLETARIVLVPIVLSISLIPLMHLVVTYQTYTHLFSALDINEFIDKKVRRYTMRKIVCKFGLRFLNVREFRKNNWADLIRLRTKRDIDVLLEQQV